MNSDVEDIDAGDAGDADVERENQRELDLMPYVELAKACGADCDGGFPGDYSVGIPPEPPIVYFTDRQFHDFVQALGWPIIKGSQ